MKKDSEGVASTIGTIMALLIFLTLLTMITNSYVPAWMTDNEREHQNTVIDQFGSLKGDIDSMIVQQEIRGDSSIKMYAPITLGSSGVPVFATPTSGFLTYSPQGTGQSSVHVWFSYTTSTNATVSVNNYGGGKVELYSPNRYYVEQHVAYENGAILVKQPDGNVIRAYPNLDLNKVNNKINIAFTQVDLLGANLSISGSDSVGLNIDLVYIDSQTYAVAGDGTWKMSMNTTYGSAWYRFLSETCASSGLTNNTDYIVTLPTETSPGSGIYKVDLTIKNAGTLMYSRGFVSMATST